MPTFMFADLAGFTALTEAHGDADASELARRFEVLVRERLPPGARLVKMMGDAAMIVADDPLAAVLLARDLLTAVEQLPGRPAVRIGLHIGDAVERAGDYWGHAVNVAARIAARAEPCQALMSGAVSDAAEASAALHGVNIVALGAQRVRNVSETLDLYAIAAECDGFPTDPVCRMRLAESEGVGSIRHMGRAYRFCSFDCMARFSADPAAYVTDGN